MKADVSQDGVARISARVTIRLDIFDLILARLMVPHAKRKASVFSVAKANYDTCYNKTRYTLKEYFKDEGYNSEKVNEAIEYVIKKWPSFKKDSRNPNAIFFITVLGHVSEIWESVRKEKTL